jgi:hypothetical protein
MTTVMALPRPISCDPRSQAMWPARGSGLDVCDSRYRRLGITPAQRAGSASVLPATRSSSSWPNGAAHPTHIEEHRVRVKRPGLVRCEEDIVEGDGA